MSIEKDNLLIELGTEELPPKGLKSLTDGFASLVANELTKLGFSYDNYESFGAPRRLGIKLNGLPRSLPDEIVEKRGPAVSVAFDGNGEPTKAAMGWAKSNGISVDQAERMITPKGEWLLHKANVKGKTLDDELSGVLARAVKSLPIPKPMRWGSGTAEFIRPVHTLTVLFGDTIINSSVLGIAASNTASGHRFHGDNAVTINHADEYKDVMKAQYVIADYSSRVAAIKEQLLHQAKELGLVADFDQTLLEEISSLVEWPVVLQASFEEKFLDVPKEALIYTMKDDQKYVPLLDQQGNLSNVFLFVSNIESKDPKQVIAGNQRVIRPRLADAQFFFETDKKTTLSEKSAKLSTILFQKELGTIQDKSQRVTEIVEILGQLFGNSEADIAHAKRAAAIAKADLVSNMVMEFTSIQGVMGKHYAIHDGEDEKVASAIEEQYLPRFANDKVPTDPTSVLLSLAEKLDTLIGIFGINILPKGDKDPFALRRAAIGILRIMLENELDVPISNIIQSVLPVFTSRIKNENVEAQVVSFLYDRCKPYYADREISADVINAVMAVNSDLSFIDLEKRLNAVSSFAKTEEGPDLIAANKRVNNILNKNEIRLTGQQEVNPDIFTDETETALYDALGGITLASSQSEIDYSALLSELTNLKQPLADFFENVMIMVEDEKVKMNRIRLVSNVRNAFLTVADISIINV